MSEIETKLDKWDEIVEMFIKEREENKIVDLLSKKDSKKSLGDEKQAIILQLEYVLKKTDKVNNTDIEKIVGEKNTGKIKIPKIEFVTNQYNKLMELNPDLNSANEISNRYDEKREQILKEHVPKNWLDTYARYASGVSFATHVSKLTHSSIKGASSFYVKKAISSNNAYLSTSDLKKPIVDSAIDNAAYTPVASMLKLERNGVLLADLLAVDDATPFKKYTSDENQLKVWMKEFKSVLYTDRKASHYLSKQIYFPLNDRSCGYHLLCNVMSSTLAHHIFEEASHKKIQKPNEAFKKNKFHQNEINYYNKSVLAVTSFDSAKNVSPLHSKRRGELTLFSSQPPAWQTQLKPPTNKVSLFFDIYNSTIKTELDYLRDFLLRFKRLDLSIKDPKRKRHLIRWVENIIDECLFYIGTIQNLPAGWSATDNIRLKSEHQYLLDPYRLDDSYQTERQSTQWQSVICADFSQWLNRQLRGKDKQFTPQAEHTRLWKKLMEQALREYMEPIEQEIKQSIKGAV